MSPDLPGYPPRHRREPDLAAERKRWSIPPRVRISIPPPDSEGTPSDIKRWQIILAIVVAVGGIATTCATGAVSIASTLREPCP